MRKVLLFLVSTILLLALTPLSAEADCIPHLRDKPFYGAPISIWENAGSYDNSGIWDDWGEDFGSCRPYYSDNGWYGADDYYSDPYPFGHWYGVNNTAYLNNPFGTWTGVNNMTDYNPFGTWTGVDNTNYLNDPFGTWSGVRNMDSYNNPIGSWSGVRNMDSLDNPFGSWSGVRNMDSTISTQYRSNGFTSNSKDSSEFFGSWSGVDNSESLNNPFGTWTGVSNMTNSNPFGTWSGVNNVNANSSGSNSGFDAQGYQANTRPQVKGYQSTVAQENSESYPSTTSTSTTNFIAPRAGVNHIAPFIFAGLLTALSALILKRRTVFSFLKA